jgi:UDP-N-acetylmuramoylalanine--D-glutamate ligase
MNKRSKIAILGFGIEGQAILSYLTKHDYTNITICDQNVDIKDSLPRGVSASLGQKYLDGLDKFDAIFRSPGIKYLDPHIQAAKVRGTEVTSAANFFIDQCPGIIIGVTGTKGKGTTCTLIYEMLKKSGKKTDKDVFLGGNIGKCPIEFLDKVKAKNIAVLELSSFQLQDLAKSPHYAVLLNTTSDHLDYHIDKEEYLAAKEQMLIHQNKNCTAVINKDYEYSKYYSPLVKGKLKFVSVKGHVKDGAFVEDGWIFCSKNGKKEKIVKVSEVALIGSHNLENILPAVVIAKEFKVKNSDIAHVVKTFKGLPYRLEFVRELKGVKFYNDSNSTTPETSMAAVDSFSAPTVLIAGGSDKGADYNEWALKILTKPSLHTVILIGQIADKMEKALVDAENKLGDALGSPTKILRRKTLEEAVLDGYAESEKGGVVVLSPAAASFDMFKNYKERGNEFNAHVRKLS